MAQRHIAGLVVIGLLAVRMAAGDGPGDDPLVVVGGLHGMVNAHLSKQAHNLLERRESLVAGLDSRARIEERQRYIRERFVESLGGFPDRTPLNARITRTLERDEYRVEMLVYESLPGFYVTANVYVPKDGTPPHPAVLGVAGHSANGKASSTYQHVWISLAKRGFVVLAFDPPGQGERSLYFDPELGRSRVGIGTLPGGDRDARAHTVRPPVPSERAPLRALRALGRDSCNRLPPDPGRRGS